MSVDKTTSQHGPVLRVFFDHNFVERAMLCRLSGQCAHSRLRDQAVAKQVVIGVYSVQEIEGLDICHVFYIDSQRSQLPSSDLVRPRVEKSSVCLGPIGRKIWSPLT